MTETVIKLARAEILAALVERDGTTCQFPGENHELDFTAESGPAEVTIDHWMPQYWCKNNHWTYEEIWDLSNLKLMCKKHNAKKGDRIPNDDGSLPERAVRKFRYRRDKRAERPEFCTSCDNGHNLAMDEVCGSCGSDAQRFPRWAKVRVQDCDHEAFWCWACSIGVIERTPAMTAAMRHGMSDSDREPDSE